jgi:hypothetical protein
VLPNSNENPIDLQAWASALSEEIEVLRSEIQRSQAALSEAEEKRSLVQRLMELDRQAVEIESSTNHAHPFVPFTVTLNSADNTEANSHDLEDAVAAILDEAGSPLHISAIRRRLIDNGVRIPGRGDDANVIVRLRKDPDRFTRTARGTYALTAWGLPSLDTLIAKRNRRRTPQ